SETAARLPSASVSVESIFGTTFIGYSPGSRELRASVPRTTKLVARLSGRSILTASRPSCGNARSFPRPARAPRDLPGLLVGGGNALAGGTVCGLADRTGDRYAVDDLLLGADLALPSVVGGGQRLARDEAGSGPGDVDLGGLVGL